VTLIILVQCIIHGIYRKKLISAHQCASSQLKIRGREYDTMTVRGLYNYVMNVVKHRPQNVTVQRKSPDRSLSTLATVDIYGATTTGPPINVEKSEFSDDISPSLPFKPKASPLRNLPRNQAIFYNTEGHAVTYRERLGGYLHPRDMRRLVTPFSTSNEPELIVRRHVMLLNFDPLRAIVLRDRLLVLVPDGADSILISLEKSVRGGLDELQNEVFGDDSSRSVEEVYRLSNQKPKKKTDDGKNKRNEINNLDFDSDQSLCSDIDDQNSNSNIYDEWGDIEEMNWIKMSFELQSVDAVLSVVCKMLSEDSSCLRGKVLGVIEELRGDSLTTAPGDHVQERLRIHKDGVKEMEARVQGFVRAMNNILNDDEDMALMNLSRVITHPERFIQPVSQEILNEESDEPELILEAYMQQALSEVNALELLKGNILNTEELVSLKMDTVRNRLLYINTMVSVFSLCIAGASLIGSLFGMNLKNNLEEDENAFLHVIFGTVAGCLALLTLFIILISRSGLIKLRTIPSHHY